MAHRALALKYRPQVFSDLVGQEHVSTVLTRAIESNRVAQAYLFTGARGVGKTTSARILAKALNCERRSAGKRAPGEAGSGVEPCNACTSCTEITTGASLDVAEIDGASNRGIADVQALREKVRFSPTGGRWRVVIIDEVHQLSNDAFAALLKTLEEPPPHLVFIFATTDPQKLPDTIRSRTQRFDFARVPLRKIADRLQAIAERERADKEGVKFTLDDGAALLIAQKAEGSMRDAVSALDQVVSAGEKEIDEALVRRILGIADRESFFRIAGAVMAHDPKAALGALHEAFGKGMDPRDIAEGLGEHVRHLLVLRVDPTADDLVPLSHHDIERLRTQGEGWTEHDLLRLLKLSTDCVWPMRDSGQPMVHLEAAVLHMATLEPGETLAALVAKLEALEQRLGGVSGSGSGSGSAGTPSRGASLAGAGGSARGTATSRASGYSAAGPSAGAGSGGHATPAPVSAAPRAASAPVSARPLASASAGGDPIIAPAPPLASEPKPAVVEAPAATAMLDDVPADEIGTQRWTQLVARVNQKKPLLGAFLSESQFQGIAGGAIRLAMDDLHRAVVDEKENRAIVAAEVEQVFGSVLGLAIVAPGAPLAKPRPTVDDLKPAVDRAIAWFEGEVIDRPARGQERA